MVSKVADISSMTDEELMFRISKGETLAFDVLYERYGHRLLVYFTRMLNFDKEHAQDALQELFLKIVEAPERFNPSMTFRTWVFSVAHNYCKNFYRRNGIKTDYYNDAAFNVNGTFGDEALETISKMDAKAFNKLLYAALEDLSPEKKEAFILKYQEDRSLAEIAVIQNCPEGSVKSRIHYTIKILESKLEMFNPLK